MTGASLAAFASPYAERWTPRAARPEGSRFFDHAASHSTAFAVLQAMLGPPGTVDLAEFCLKKPSKRFLSEFQTQLHLARLKETDDCRILK